LELKQRLLRSLDALREGFSPDAALAALLRAGELECGVADCGSVPVLPFARLTDCLAEALLRHSLPAYLPEIQQAVAAADVPERMALSAPEGFAYYALHPLAYAGVLERLPALPQNVLVAGIRSIGSTLSTVAAAAARLRGLHATRITVRPQGHPYDRKTELASAERALVEDAIASSAVFLVADEGPGLSGSSFLSVAEALENAGAPPEKIWMLCGHEPDPRALCASNAARRWQRFRHMAAAAEPRRPQAATDFIGAGHWRNLLFPGESCWPESWTSMERLKYLSPHGGAQPGPPVRAAFARTGVEAPSAASIPGEYAPRRLYKFAGLGH